jgi:hypothetical protein
LYGAAKHRRRVGASLLTPRGSCKNTLATKKAEEEAGTIMSSISNLSRRALVKWGLVSAGLPAMSRFLASPALAQDAGSESGKIGEVGGRAEGELYPGKGLPGGGQLEIRLTASIYTSDPDALEVAQRMKPSR